MDHDDTSILARNLSKRFGGQRAITDLSFQIKKGEIVGFLGPNGAGKSTTLRIMTGIIPASSGYLSVCGKAVPYHAEEIRQHIGYMPENNPLPEEMRVIEYLRFRARIKGIPWNKRKERIQHVMEVCELHHKARRKIIGTLSKGFRQRVGIADAILAAPAITILDEPTIGLDPHQIIAIRRLLNNLRGETTVIFSSHILAEVEVSCDRVLILNQGRLVAEGTSSELRREFLPGSRFRLRVEGEESDVRKCLQSLGEGWKFQVDPSPDETLLSVLLIKPENGVRGDHILEHLLTREHLRIHTFQPVEPSLEDIFLMATRRSWEHTSDSGSPRSAGSATQAAS